MMKAIQNEMHFVIAYLLIHGEDPSLIPKMLRQSVENSFPHPDLRNIFFWKKSSWFTLLNNKEDTAIHYAAENGNVNLANILIEKGADIELKNTFNTTALYIASDKGHVNLVKLLFDKGADIEATNNDGKSALHGASAFGNVETV